MRNHRQPRGRGTRLQLPNRFEESHYEVDEDSLEEWRHTDPEQLANHLEKGPKTQCISDDSQTIITRNRSPDLGFEYSLNPYRGCEHGCSYCYARPYHEFLGYSAGLDFETRLMVKEKAPDLLEVELARKSWKPRTLACSGVTDCYQPIEKQYRITRECLRVLRDFRNPIGVVTKNALVTRDSDYLAELAHFNAAVVAISLTSLDPNLAGKLEPRATRPSGRLQAISELADAGVPVGISLAPVIPGLNDHEIPAILEAAREAGASFASYSMIRLPFSVRDIFTDWLENHFPERKGMILGRIREMRGGQLNDSRFGVRMSGSGIVADQVRNLFGVAHRRAGFPAHHPELEISHFRRRIPGQLELFD